MYPTETAVFVSPLVFNQIFGLDRNLVYVGNIIEHLFILSSKKDRSCEGEGGWGVESGWTGHENTWVLVPTLPLNPRNSLDPCLPSVAVSTTNYF